MSVFKFGFVLVLSMVFASTTVQLFGQQSNSVSIFAPTFSADFEDVLVESPPDDRFSNVANRGSKKANFVQVAVALPGESAAGKGCPNDRCANDRCANDGCANEACPASDPPASTAICVAGSRAAAGACCQACCPNPEEDMTSHCQLMAKLLAIAIQDQAQSDDARRQVIEAALLMIAETSEAKAQAKIARLEASHQKQLTDLRSQLEQSNPPSSSVSQIREWLGPIYTNQNRNFHQLQTMAANGQSLNRQVGLLERKIDAVNQSLPAQTIQNRLYGEAMPARSKNHRKAEVIRPLHQRDQKEIGQTQRIRSSELANQLRQEIHELQNRLKILQSQTVRPANHLEPVFNPDQPLRPLYNR